MLSPHKHENLNIGCGYDIDPRFTNTDMRLDMGADALWDLEGKSPFQDGQFQTIVASHILEHVYRLMPLMDEIYRILKPGGHLIVFVPYWSSMAAIANPEHVRFFCEQSWAFFDKTNNGFKKGANCRYDNGWKHDFFTEAVILEPEPDLLKDSAVEKKIRSEINVVREMCAVLRKQ